MKRAIGLLPLLFLLGCAGNRGEEPEVVFLQVVNHLHYTVRVYWQQPYHMPDFLGKIQRGQKKEFLLKGPFAAKGIRLIARPLSGGETVVAQLPVQLERGKRLIWEISKNHFYWTER